MNTCEVEEGTLQYPGGKLSIRLFKNEVCGKVSRDILSGNTYPHVHFVAGVRTVVDIGANVGAASIFFALLYPQATIFALEPSRSAYELLHHNVSALRNVKTFNCGLFSSDKTVPLYAGLNDSVESSVCPSDRTSSEGENVKLRSAAQFFVEQGLQKIDILKIDTEGCEVHILRSLRNLLPSIKVIYVEYHSDRDRRLIDELLADTHILWRGRSDLAYRGEFCYLRRQLLPAAKEIYSTEIMLPLD